MPVLQRLSSKPLQIARRHILRALPITEAELDDWVKRAAAIPDPELRRQAESSLAAKRFHCQGGSVFATWEPHRQKDLIDFIVAFQTISDYLDNLCDRTESRSELDFRSLHRSMIDAVSPGSVIDGDYYRYHPRGDDGGYLLDLVSKCRETVERFPNYAGAAARVRRLVGLYIDLQVYKHIEVDERTPKLTAWFDLYRDEFPDLRWWEFAAAAGSTLGVFALVAEAARARPIEDADRLMAAYFPWICGLHILLDYFIDQNEDRREGDLNFVSYYANRLEALERMRWMIENARAHADRLNDTYFHHTVIEGLLGLYLSDGKVRRERLGRAATKLVGAGGWRAWLVWGACHVWRITTRESRRTQGL